MPQGPCTESYDWRQGTPMKDLTNRSTRTISGVDGLDKLNLTVFDNDDLYIEVAVYPYTDGDNIILAEIAAEGLLEYLKEHYE